MDRVWIKVERGTGGGGVKRRVAPRSSGLLRPGPSAFFCMDQLTHLDAHPTPACCLTHSLYIRSVLACLRTVLTHHSPLPPRAAATTFDTSGAWQRDPSGTRHSEGRPAAITDAASPSQGVAPVAYQRQTTFQRPQPKWCDKGGRCATDCGGTPARHALKCYQRARRGTRRSITCDHCDHTSQ